MVRLSAEQVAFAGRLSPTDLALDAGCFVAVVGPNGGGKTSLLRSLAGMEDARGEVRIDGELISGLGEARRRALLSFLPASRDISWPISVRDVIAMGLASSDNDRISELIALFELETLSERPVSRLSTGERSRVLIARALAARPKLLLLDEPMANLEPYWVLLLTRHLRGLSRQDTLVLVALHDLHLLDQFDRVLLVAEGKVQLDAAPAELIASEQFRDIFRIEPDGSGWALRPEDRQSSR